jgi:hypothetical protein
VSFSEYCVDVATDDEQPYRFPLRMKPGFGSQYTREQTVGSPIRYTLGDGDGDGDGEVIVEGFVVGWIDEPDGGVTLTVEAEPM